MSQKIWSVEMDMQDGEEVAFNVIAPDEATAAQLFSRHVVGTWITGDDIEAAEEMDEPFKLVINRIHDTCRTPEDLPSRVIPWEETARSEVNLPHDFSDDSDPAP